MGAFLSLAGIKGTASEYTQVSCYETRKRPKLSLTPCEETLRLIPNLPDEISIQILARLPRIYHFKLNLVSRKWKETFRDAELFKWRKELKKTEEWVYVLTKVGEDKLFWHALDPLAGLWLRLPPMPHVIYEEEEDAKSTSRLWMWSMMGPSNKIADVIKGWLGRKDPSDQMPFCGCTIGAVEGCLYVLGGFSRGTTMKCVWRFNPVLNAWNEVTSMSIGRAYCKTGTLNNKLYVVGGVTRGPGGLNPLQSAEAFDPCTSTWSEVPSMPFSRGQLVPTAFLAGMLKPIATGMTTYRGKLCVPQSLYSWPFFVDVGGEMYDPDTNKWVEMPNGMGEGWPAKQAGTKMSVVVDGELYAFDPSSTLDSGKIKVYDETEDVWKVVIGKVPVCDLTDSEAPYLLAGFYGKLHFITKDVYHRIMVLQADLRANLDCVPSTSTRLSHRSYEKHSFLEAESDTVIWKVIANRDFPAAELVSCQVLDL